MRRMRRIAEKIGSRRSVLGFGLEADIGIAAADIEQVEIVERIRRGAYMNDAGAADIERAHFATFGKECGAQFRRRRQHKGGVEWSGHSYDGAIQVHIVQ